MHEASVTASIIDAAIAELENYDVLRVNALNVVIGDLTQLGTEQMEFAYRILTEGTILEGSRFNVIPEPVEVRCKECGFEGLAKVVDFGEDSIEHNIPVLACPECGGAVDVVRGESCAIRDIDIEEKVKGEERWHSNTGTRRQPKG